MIYKLFAWLTPKPRLSEIMNRRYIMELKNALEVARLKAISDAKAISDLTAENASLKTQIAAAPSATAAKALADAVMGVDTATLPEPDQPALSGG